MDKKIKTLLDNLNKNKDLIRNILNKYTDKIQYEDKNKYDTLCTCLDFLDDTTLAIEYFYKSNEYSKKATEGEIYLKLFGLVDCLNRQLNTILEIYKALDLKNTYLILEKESGNNNKLYNSNAFSVFIHRYSISEEKLELEINDKNTGKTRFEKLSYETLIYQHLESINAYLAPIKNKLEVDYEK